MLRWWKNLKLRNKLFVSMALISALLTGAALLAVQIVVTRHIDDDLGEELRNSVTTFQNFQRRSEALSVSAVTLLSDLPNLKAVMTTDDPATIQDASEGISRIGGGSLFVLADRAGRVVGLHPATGALSRPTAERLFHNSIQGAVARAWWYGDGHLYEVFLHPIWLGAPAEGNAAGMLAYGQQIDQSIAEQISHVALGKVIFSYGNRPVVSTLTTAQLRQFEGLRLVAASQLKTMDVRLGAERYAAATVQLDGAAPGLTLTVLKSYDNATAFLRALNRLILVVGLAALFIGAGLVYLISLAFSRPLSTLVTGAQALEQGDYGFPLTADSDDEAGQLTAAFNRMRTTLQQTQQGMLRAARMEALGQLAGGVAHDFNNVLTVINGFSELLLKKLPPEDSNVRYAQEIRKAGTRAAGLTRQLLVFSRKQAARTQPVDLNSTVFNMMKMLRMLVGEDIDMVLSQGSKLAQIEIDPTHIEQVLMNLVANARDAMPRGGKLTVEACNVVLEESFTRQVPGLAPGSYVVLSVSDTGSGMDEETQRRIFEPFFTTKEVGKGTGLGLATVYGIVRQCGGHIAVTSAPGQGTTFNLYFPALASRREATGSGAAAADIRSGTGTLLLVEDDDALRSLEQETLANGGYTVLEASNGLDALELSNLRTHPIDLVLTDIVMPKMGGRELIAELLKRRPELRVIYTSGYIYQAESDLRGDHANTHFLEKPFTPTELLQKVQEVLRGETLSATSGGV